jgi:hypothetical protein
LRNLQPAYKAVKEHDADKLKLGNTQNKAKLLVESGIPTSVLAKRVVEALQSGQTYIFTHPNFRSSVAYRASLLDAAFADAEDSPIVRHLKDDEIMML